MLEGVSSSESIGLRLPNQVLFFMLLFYPRERVHFILIQSALDQPGPRLLSSSPSACHGAWPRVDAQSLARLRRVGHEPVGVQGATAFFEGFAQPATVGQVVLFTEATGLAVVATLDTM
jgi:hypothetical protein